MVGPIDYNIVLWTALFVVELVPHASGSDEAWLGPAESLRIGPRNIHRQSATETLADLHLERVVVGI